MHNAAMACLGLSHHYSAYQVSASGLQAAIAGAQAMGFLGLNLTIPHKVAAVDCLDELAAGARRIGAVNTVQFIEGRSMGHNTDAPGFIAACRELTDNEPSQLMLLGSGGAAKAVADGVGEAWPSCEIHWLSRRPKSIEIPEHLRAQVRPRAYCELETGAWPQDCTLWVNATSVGLDGGPAEFPTPLPISALGEAHGVVDIVYSDRGTDLLRKAQARGAAVQDGRSMLLWQGVLALEIWLQRGISPEAIAAMRSCLDLPEVPVNFVP